MRNKLLFAIFLFPLLAVTGCKKYLDLPPKNQRTVVSMADMKALLGAYLRGVAELRVKPLYGQVMPGCPANAILMFEAYSDNIDFERAITESYLKPNNSRTEASYADLLLWNQHATSTLIWTHHYDIIGFLNSLIDQMDEIQDATPQQRDQYIGEMKINRAYSIFKLLEYYGVYDKAELGIPVYLHTGQGVLGIKLPRLSHAEVYKIILDDLTEALTMINRTAPLQGFNAMYNKRYINHILAQVYWFKAESPAKEDSDYENARIHSLAALESVDASIPTTATGRMKAYAAKDPNYPALCQENNDQGGISAIYGSEFQYLSPGTYGPDNIPLAADFCELFVPTDIRIANYFNTDPTRSGGLVGPEGRILNWGWPTDGNVNGHVKRGNVCLFKPEEAYLILAEALLKLNQPQEALNTLNKFKGFRDAGTVSGTANLLNEIIDERRREFFGDSDKRWIDLKRYANKTITRNITFFGKAYNITVPPNDFRYALPIPLNELQQNNNLVPNAGWQILEY